MNMFPRLSVSVLLVTGLAVGCGDDDPTTPVQPVDDAGSESTLSTGSSNGAESTSGTEPSTDESSTSSGTPSTDGSGANTTDSSMSAVDGGDTGETPTTEVDGSVSDGGTEGETSTAVNDGGSSSPADDGGVAACGALGELCCASGGFGGGQGTCDEGFECNNPAGEGLANSECVVEVITTVDAGDGGAEACGGEGELCCASGGFGGTCDEGFECDNPAGEGLANSECVTP